MDNDLFYSGKYVACKICKRIVRIERYKSHLASTYHEYNNEKLKKINYCEYFNK